MKNNLALSEKSRIFAVKLTNKKIMAFKYDLHENPKPNGVNKKRYHARPANNGTMSADELIRHMAKHNGMSEAVITSVLMTLHDVLVERLSEGDNICIPGLGNMQATLSCPETRTPSATRAGSIKIKSVKLKAEKALIKEVASKAKFERTRFKTHSQQYDEDQFVSLIARYLSEHDFITRRVLEYEFGLQPRTANNKLKQLVEDSILKNVSPDKHHPLYVLTDDVEMP